MVLLSSAQQTRGEPSGSPPPRLIIDEDCTVTKGQTYTLKVSGTTSGTYGTYVMSSSAMLNNGLSGSQYLYVSTTNRSDGNGQNGFGFQLQDYVTTVEFDVGSFPLTYVGYRWYGCCTYDANFAHYTGNATSYYAHTWRSADISNISLGVSTETLGIDITFSNNDYSFAAYSSGDTPF